MLFLSDLDGTLMDSHCEISKEDVLAIRQWTKKNAFGLVTGRDEAFCKDLLKKYDLSCECIIANNGATAYYKDALVYSSCIDIQEAISMCETILSYKEAELFYTDECGNRYYPMRVYGKKRFERFQSLQPSLKSFQNMDIVDYLQTRKNGCAKLSLYVENHLFEYLPKYKAMFSDYEVMATSKDYIEITRKNTNKWKALQHIPYKHAAFIGDGENDVCILEHLKDTYVMDHAPKSVKQWGVCVESVAQAIKIESEKMYV